MTGSGTQEAPYIIYDVNDLQAVENDLSAYYDMTKRPALEGTPLMYWLRTP